MTTWEIFLAILVVLVAIGVMLGVFYLWFSVWKYVSDHSENIVRWEDGDAEENKPEETDSTGLK